MRSGEVNRKTAETEIRLSINLDGSGRSSVSTGVGFLDHMLTLFAAHGRFDLEVSAEGDTWVDDHHTVEDVGIALGEAFAQALGDKKGICRYGHMILPMDETLVLAAVDFSGRASCNLNLGLTARKVGTFDTELVEEFWVAFVRNCPCGLHIRKLAGINTHHIIEGAFKSAGRSMRRAVAIDDAFAGEIPSTKGVL